MSYNAYFSTDYDYLFKLLLIGDSGVGKSSILTRFSDNHFAESCIPTIGVDFKIKQIIVDNKKAKLQIWDTAGQDRFKAITTSFYRGAAGIIVVFDLTDLKTFKNVESWLFEIEKFADDKVQILLVGNKADLESKRNVTYLDAVSFAEEKGMIYIETSARDNTNIESLFVQMTKDLVKTKVSPINLKHNKSKNKTYNSFQNITLSNSNKPTCACNLL